MPEAEVSEPPIRISVSIFENTGHSYLAGPLSLQCPASSTPASVLELLCSYAYLDSVLLEGETLLSITADDRTYGTGDDGSGWMLIINGQTPDSLSDEGVSDPADENLQLQSGDVLEWIYRVGENNQEVVSADGYAARGGGGLDKTLWQSEYNNLMNRACSWLKSSRRNAEALYTLGSAGVAVDHKYLTNVLREIIDSDPNDAGALADGILAVSFCGISAENISGRNLILELANCPDVDRQEAMLALAAADCNNYSLPKGSSNERSALLNVILAAQNEDGSVSSLRGETGTTLATALALTVLAPYCDDQAVRTASDRGIDYLAAQLDPATGGYLDSSGALSCKTTASVITALSSLGVPLSDERFCPGDTNLLQLMFTLQLDNGGFSETPDGNSDISATEAAILAMVAQKNSHSPYLLRSPITGSGSPVLPTSEVAAESSEVSVSETDSEPVAGISFLFGAAGLAIGILLGAIALFAAVRLMKRADKEDEAKK